MQKTEVTGWATLAIACCFAAFAYRTQHPHGPEPVSIEFASAGYVPRYERVDGVQLVMLYFGKASCAWSNQPDLPAIVENAKRSLRARADSLGLGFTTVGIALDWSAPLGLAHLAKFGVFDEVAAGGNWANSLALRYIWASGVSGPAATPQLVVIERTLTADSTGSFEEVISLGDERQLARKVGIHEIRRWESQHFRFPRGSGAEVVSMLDPVGDLHVQ